MIGVFSVAGRSLIVHEGEDDFGLGGHADSKTTGHAGARVYVSLARRTFPPHLRS
jgi:Cu-Zn family superoxide dismutase